MEQRPALRRSRPPEEQGPRLLPIALALAAVGFGLGAGGKLLYSHLQHGSKQVAPQATPSPNYALVGKNAPGTHLPPIPTPRGTWYIHDGAQPFRVVLTPLVKPTITVTPKAPSSPRPAAVPTDVVTPAPTSAPTTSPTPEPTAKPTAKPTAEPMPVAKATLHAAAAHMPVVVHHHAVAQVTAAPTAVSLVKPSPTLVPPPPVEAVTPQPSASERVVRRYLSSLIGGNEATAYMLLGAAPGDRDVHLSEESFINTSAHVTSVRSRPGEKGIVHAEIETGSGTYFATYYTDHKDGHLIIVSHDFIKL